MKKLLLSLDLDETLIHSLPLYSNSDIESDFILSNGVNVLKRPMLDYFMSFIDKNKNIEYGFFSKAGSQYVEEIVNEICKQMNKKPLFVLNYNNMTKIQNYENMYCSGYNQSDKIKDLKKIKKYSEDGFKRIVAIDDLMNYPRQRGNVIMIKPFEGDKKDKELLKIKKMINFLIDKENVRDYIKNYTIDNNLIRKNDIKKSLI